MYERYEPIARVISTHGKRGEFAAEPVRGLPPLLHAGLEVSCVPPALTGPRLLRVASAASFGRGASQLVALEGSGDLNAASELVGKTIICRRAELPEGFEALAVGDLAGREAADARHGVLGTIVRIDHGPAQDLLVIEGPAGELLVPCVDEFIADRVSDPVLLQLPDGLIEEGRA